MRKMKLKVGDRVTARDYTNLNKKEWKDTVVVSVTAVVVVGKKNIFNFVK